MRDRRALLSTLWIFVMFNYVYADILKLYFNPSLQRETAARLAAGYEGSVRVTQGLVLAAAVVLEIAIAMVVLSRILRRRENRWANIVASAVQIGTVTVTLYGQALNAFYALFAAAEIACMVFIVWYAWTWRPDPAQGG